MPIAKAKGMKMFGFENDILELKLLSLPFEYHASGFF